MDVADAVKTWDFAGGLIDQLNLRIVDELSENVRVRGDTRHGDENSGNCDWRIRRRVDEI